MAPLVVALLLLLTTSTPAQQIRTSGAPNPAIDYQRLTRIDTLIHTYLRNNWLKGLVTLVVKDNQVVQYKGYGSLDTQGKIPMPKDALFRLASQSKALVSTAILTLYEQGKFTLDEPIWHFIPAFQHPTVLNQYHAADTTYTTLPAKREITFRDLLTHTSGIDYPVIGSPNMKAIYAKNNLSSGLGVVDQNLLERMQVLAKLPLAHQPGERWTYGLSIDVLGALVEVISGKDLETYLRETIFQPLGMKDTYFNVPAAKAGRLAAVYTEDSLQHVIPMTEIAGVDPNYPLAKKHYFSGGAGLTGTAWDYAIFLQMLLNHGTYNGAKILSPRTVEIMTSGQLAFTFNGADNFGLGFDITSDTSAARNPRNAGSFAWGGYFGTTYWADPKAHLIVLIMTQQSPNTHYDYSYKLEELIYQAIQ
ncbi:serine hydrolase [Chitinophaga costaii]|nr:serine hydrolase [Chitinophaga costaii]